MTMPNPEIQAIIQAILALKLNYGLPPQQAELLIEHRELAEYFEECVAWQILNHLTKKGLSLEEIRKVIGGE